MPGWCCTWQIVVSAHHAQLWTLILRGLSTESSGFQALLSSVPTWSVHSASTSFIINISCCLISCRPSSLARRYIWSSIRLSSLICCFFFVVSSLPNVWGFRSHPEDDCTLPANAAGRKKLCARGRNAEPIQVGLLTQDKIVCFFAGDSCLFLSRITEEEMEVAIFVLNAAYPGMPFSL